MDKLTQFTQMAKSNNPTHFQGNRKQTSLDHPLYFGSSFIWSS